MGFSSLFQKFKPAVEEQEKSGAPTPARSDSNLENDGLAIDDSPVKFLTWRSFILGVVVSMGGFVFGYSTGTFRIASAIRKEWFLIAATRSNRRLYNYG